MVRKETAELQKFKCPERQYNYWLHRSERVATPFPPRPNRTVGAMHAAKYKM